MALVVRQAVAVAFILLAALEVSAQIPDGHTEHHPAPGMSAPAAPGAPPPGPSTGTSGLSSAPETGTTGGNPAGTGGMMGMMREMMGAPPRKEFYPALMDLPTLSREQRQAIESQARAWISAGTDEIALAEDALRHANAAGDTAGAEQAAQRLRQGLNQVSSGTAALTALAEGKAPRDIALSWFKRELNLPSSADVPSHEGPLGLSWFHLITMGVVSAFAVTMIAIYLSRMRRAHALIDRLSTANATPAAAPPPSPTMAAAVPPSTAVPIVSAQSPAPSSVNGGHAASIADPTLATKRTRPALWKGKLRVAAIFQETHNVKTFRLRDPQGGPIPFTFIPGHFLTYSAEIDGKLVRRSYTIASSAAQTAYVETTIKREDEGIFSGYMHEKIKEGDLVDVMGPSGVFTFSGSEAESVVLIGGGVGITPLMAAIRYLNDIAWPGEIFLVYGARSTEDFIFREELEYLQSRHHNLQVVATMSRAAGTAWMGPQGPITEELLTQAVPEITKRRVHLCGPPGMMEAMKKVLAELGVPNEQIKTEAFGPATGAVPPPGVTVVTPIQTSFDRVDAAAPSAPAAIGPATASIRFARSDKTAPLPPDKSVLEVAESIDVPIDYSCRVGICGICKTQLLEGKVTMEVQDALTPEDKEKNIILACQAKSIGNLVVDA